MENTKIDAIAIVIVAALIVILAVFMNLALNLNLVQNLIMGWTLTIFYSVFTLFISGATIFPISRNKINEIIKEVEKPIYIDRPVYIEKQVPIQIPIENKTIEVVEVEKPAKIIYVNKPRKKLNIPKYNYLASTEAKVYHKRNCRFSKLIKKKFKFSSNNKDVFIKKKYHACKLCIKK
ncbi:MAG: hypothetical protein WCX73_01220 [Candidatus Pacearchaeota archaeon]|jgi:hypothetical protein